MIVSIFENLFEPVAEDEYLRRREPLFKLIAQFEKDISENHTDGDDNPDTVVNRYDDEHSHFDEEWWEWEDIYTCLYDEFPSEPDYGEQEAQNICLAYQKWWKAKQ